MNGVFSRLARASRETVERVHGKAVTIVPVNSADVNRPTVAVIAEAYDTVACFYQNTMMENEANAQPLNGFGGRSLHRSARIQASIRLIAGRSIKTNYYILRIEDGAWFSITQFDADGEGNVMAQISAASAPEGF